MISGRSNAGAQQTELPKAMVSKDIQRLKPIILPVPSRVRQWHASERVAFLSRHARKALRICAEKCSFELGELNKDDTGMPLPSHGYYWSLTHKPMYVAGVISPGPVGIDLEEIRDIHEGLYRRVAAKEEWRSASGLGDRKALFFRFWTAKEAVMKAAGSGLKDLSRIKIKQVPDQRRISLAFRGTTWRVQQYYFDNHIAAITTSDSVVEWSIAESP
jgi:4'-phosphopantetheinyl transferase